MEMHFNGKQIDVSDEIVVKAMGIATARYKNDNPQWNVRSQSDVANFVRELVYQTITGEELAK